MDRLTLRFCVLLNPYFLRDLLKTLGKALLNSKKQLLGYHGNALLTNDGLSLAYFCEKLLDLDGFIVESAFYRRNNLVLNL